MATIGAKSPLTLRSVPKVLEYEGSDRLKKSASPQSPQGSPLRFEVEETMDLVNVRRSPLLSALREAVTSVSGIEDFEILETIGAGFFAEVYKVRRCCSCLNAASSLRTAVYVGQAHPLGKGDGAEDEQAGIQFEELARSGAIKTASPSEYSSVSSP